MSMNPQVSAPPAPSVPFMQRRIGPLPMWSVLVAGGIVLVYVVYKYRQGSANSSAASAADPYATNATGAVPTTDYGQGFDYGYAAGLNAGGAGAAGASSATGDGDTDKTTTPPRNEKRYCWMEKDPSGHRRKVCGFGHWVKKGGQWHWVPLAPPGTLVTGVINNPSGPIAQASPVGVFPATATPLIKGQPVSYATV